MTIIETETKKKMRQRDLTYFDITVGDGTPKPCAWDSRTPEPSYCPGADCVSQELNSRISTGSSRMGGRVLEPRAVGR